MSSASSQGPSRSPTRQSKCVSEAVLGRPGDGPPEASLQPRGKTVHRRRPETGGAEGTGDAVLGESVLEEGPAAWEPAPS